MRDVSRVKTVHLLNLTFYSSKLDWRVCHCQRTKTQNRRKQFNTVQEISVTLTEQCLHLKGHFHVGHFRCRTLFKFRGCCSSPSNISNILLFFIFGSWCTVAFFDLCCSFWVEIRWFCDQRCWLHVFDARSDQSSKSTLEGVSICARTMLEINRKSSILAKSVGASFGEYCDMKQIGYVVHVVVCVAGPVPRLQVVCARMHKHTHT